MASCRTPAFRANRPLCRLHVLVCVADTAYVPGFPGAARALRILGSSVGLCDGYGGSVLEPCVSVETVWNYAAVTGVRSGFFLSTSRA